MSNSEATANEQQEPGQSGAPATIEQWLESHDEEAVVAALAARPDLMEGLAKALGEARRQRMKQQEREAAASCAPRGLVRDPKTLAKLRRLVESPFNDANRQIFSELTEEPIDWLWAPEGESTVLVAALDYLATKERVGLDWPLLILEAGALFGPAEWKAACDVVRKRSEDSLGTAKTHKMWVTMLSAPVEWVAIEKATKQSAMSRGFTTIASNYTHVEGRFKALRLALENGAGLAFHESKVGSKAQPTDSSVVLPFWQMAMRATAIEGDLADRVQFLRAMMRGGWVTKGYVAAPEGAFPRGGSFEAGPARAFLEILTNNQESNRQWTHHAAVFRALCEHEDGELGLPRVDQWGATRLRWANAMQEQRVDNAAFGRPAEMLVAALECGDDPDSIGHLDPMAAARGEAAKEAVRRAIERKELRESVGLAAPASAAKRPAGRL
jgi:hypothetical protein